MTARPWSTQPVTGAQHDAWMADAQEPALYRPRGSRPYGYSWSGRDRRWVMNPGEYAVLGMMQRLRKQGKGYAVIAKALTDSGHPTPRGKRWYATSVQRILKSTAHSRDYAGPAAVSRLGLSLEATGVMEAFMAHRFPAEEQRP